MVLFRIHFILIVHLIVAQATGMEGPLADRVRALQLTRPQIVLAAEVAGLEHVLMVSEVLYLLLLALTTLGAFLPSIIRSSYIVSKLQMLLDLLLQKFDGRVVIHNHHVMVLVLIYEWLLLRLLVFSLLHLVVFPFFFHTFITGFLVLD